MPDEHDYVDLEMSLEDAGAFVFKSANRHCARSSSPTSRRERCAGHRWPLDSGLGASSGCANEDETLEEIWVVSRCLLSLEPASCRLIPNGSR